VTIAEFEISNFQGAKMYIVLGLQKNIRSRRSKQAMITPPGKGYKPYGVMLSPLTCILVGSAELAFSCRP
jgi:hypothetical protein